MKYLYYQPSNFTLRSYCDGKIPVILKEWIDNKNNDVLHTNQSVMLNAVRCAVSSGTIDNTQLIIYAIGSDAKQKKIELDINGNSKDLEGILNLCNILGTKLQQQEQ